MMQADTTQNFINQNRVLAQDSIDTGTTTAKKFLTEKPSQNFESKHLDKPSGDGITAIFIFASLIIAISNVVYRRRFRDLLRAFLARNYSNQLMRDGDIYKEQVGALLLILYLISVPLFFSLCILHYFPDYHFELKPVIILILLASFAAIWLYRIGFINFTSILFKTNKASKEVATHIFIFNLISGISVLPFSILYFYSESSTFLIFGLIIWGLIQIYRFIRLFAIGLSYAIFSGLHLFLYLCSLEIIPIVIMLKVLSIFYL